MVDIHTHIIPGVDDGSQNIEESLEMIRISVENGVHSIVLTPHANQKGRFENYISTELVNYYREIEHTIKAERLPVNIFFGMEIFATPDIRTLIENKMVIGLNTSRYYLTEFPFDAEPDYIEFCLNEIFDAGGIPLIAHPERYFCVQDEPFLVRRWTKGGVYTQVNSGSIFGSFGNRASETVEFLFSHNLVTCIGSDAHSTHHRNTNLWNIKTYLVREYGAGYTRKVLRDHSLLILKNKQIPLQGM